MKKSNKNKQKQELSKLLAAEVEKQMPVIKTGVCVAVPSTSLR